jgi:hypothetical protein
MIFSIKNFRSLKSVALPNFPLMLVVFRSTLMSAEVPQNISAFWNINRQLSDGGYVPPNRDWSLATDFVGA